MKKAEILAEALAVLKEGGVILYPTDSVWGIGCDATNEKAVAKVFDIKRRSGAKSLVLLACDLDMVARYIDRIPDIAIDLVEVNDAPMTIIYPGARGIASNAVAEDGSVGIRIPIVDETMAGSLRGADFCREMCRRLRRPLVSTSANVSGEPTPGSYDEISDEIKSAVDYAVDRSVESGASGKASQIIKVELDGQVKIIRA